MSVVRGFLDIYNQASSSSITCVHLWVKCRGEDPLHQIRIDASGGANGYDSRARRALVPFLLKGNVHAPADYLQHRPAPWGVGAVNNSFGPVNSPRQFTQ